MIPEDVLLLLPVEEQEHPTGPLPAVAAATTGPVEQDLQAPFQIVLPTVLEPDLETLTQAHEALAVTIMAAVPEPGQILVCHVLWGVRWKQEHARAIQVLLQDHIAHLHGTIIVDRLALLEAA